jgi:hypothetical protein
MRTMTSATNAARNATSRRLGKCGPVRRGGWADTAEALKGSGVLQTKQSQSRQLCSKPRAQCESFSPITPPMIIIRKTTFNAERGSTPVIIA